MSSEPAWAIYTARLYQTHKKEKKNFVGAEVAQQLRAFAASAKHSGLVPVNQLVAPDPRNLIPLLTVSRGAHTYVGKTHMHIKKTL